MFFLFLHAIISISATRRYHQKKTDYVMYFGAQITLKVCHLFLFWLWRLDHQGNNESMQKIRQIWNPGKQTVRPFLSEQNGWVTSFEWDSRRVKMSRGEQQALKKTMCVDSKNVKREWAVRTNVGLEPACLGLGVLFIFPAPYSFLGRSPVQGKGLWGKALHWSPITIAFPPYLPSDSPLGFTTTTAADAEGSGGPSDRFES